MKNFQGRHFGGRLFAGRLFRGPAPEASAGALGGSGSASGRRYAVKRKTPTDTRRQRDGDDEVLLFLLRR